MKDPKTKGTNSRYYEYCRNKTKARKLQFQQKGGFRQNRPIQNVFFKKGNQNQENPTNQKAVMGSNASRQPFQKIERNSSQFSGSQGNPRILNKMITKQRNGRFYENRKNEEMEEMIKGGMGQNEIGTTIETTRRQFHSFGNQFETRQVAYGNGRSAVGRGGSEGLRRGKTGQMGLTREEINSMQIDYDDL